MASGVEVLFCRTDQKRGIADAFGKLRKVWPVLLWAAAAGMQEDASGIGMPHIWKLRCCKADRLDQVRRRMAVMGKRVGAKHVRDAGSAQVPGEDGIFHPDDRTIESERLDGLVKEPAPRVQINGMNGLNVDEIASEIQRGRIPNQGKIRARIAGL